MAANKISMSSVKQLLSVLTILLTITSCSWFKTKKPDDAVAKVQDHYLYKSDLVGIIPKGTSPKDSISITQNYINNWIEQQLMLELANSNLSDKQKNFDKQLEDYKNSLVIYAYEKEYVRQKLDTVISDINISSYYDTHHNDFELKDNIVNVLYVKLPLKSPAKNKISQLYKSDNPKDRESLEKLCQQEAANFFLDDNVWLIFNDLIKEIPVKTYNQEDYLKTHEFIEMEDSTFNYFVHIKGYKTKESLSPLSFEKENIKSILLNKRKLTLLENLRKETYNDAVKHSNFTIY